MFVNLRISIECKLQQVSCKQQSFNADGQTSLETLIRKECCVERRLSKRRAERLARAYETRTSRRTERGGTTEASTNRINSRNVISGQVG